MMKMFRIAAALSLVALLVGSAVVSAAPKEPKDAKCPVSGKASNPAKHADFAGGKVSHRVKIGRHHRAGV